MRQCKDKIIEDCGYIIKYNSISDNDLKIQYQSGSGDIRIYAPDPLDAWKDCEYWVGLDGDAFFIRPSYFVGNYSLFMVLNILLKNE